MNEMPLVLTLPEVAEIMRLTPQAIYDRMRRGTFLPLPFAERPHRWHRDEIEKWLRGDYREAEARIRAARRRRQRVAA